MLLQAGMTCWRVERAHRLGLFIDMEEYFVAAREAMKAARRSIHALNWAFDPDTLFEPDANGDGPPQDRFGPFLRDLAQANPKLDVRILCWRSALPVAASQNFFPHRARRCFRNTPVKFRLDGSVPFGASHHQKMIIVDDRVAFCGGGDIGPDRWDTVQHKDDDPRRQMHPHQGKDFESRHELMGLVDGPAAAALGDLFRARWKRATRESLSETEALGGPTRVERDEGLGEGAGDPWPRDTPVAAREVTIGLARTMPRWRRYPEVRENELLHLASIREAKQLIYMENQYFTSPIMADALAARLAEPDGPQVVLVSTLHSPSYFDRATMDKTRLHFLRILKDADRGGRMHAFCPVTQKGRFIIVHAKLTIIDDRLLRIGSANLNNRSTGFDTECDLVVEAAGGEDDEATARAIGAYRTQLLAHWLHCSTEAFDAAVTEHGGVAAAIQALDGPHDRLLRPLDPKPIGPIAGLISRYHLGDPVGTADSWSPWTRRRALRDNEGRMNAHLDHPPPHQGDDAARDPDKGVA